ncbi:hypothetical protein MIB92_17070 [Aestuariirhabdus sp. Z084]|uniref:hypothetical protein n=1 Tax=Aestuariirhabdus haliotis TaxID=2918751 RepID=UPI00201B36B1|nr:hypothetical protein [Aestuariirhabdus haliotis]MCL6417374.1 hypothetical protein [Aestuariirhabdus haliotis]MCL6421329.1 hypothetical protein [Aestuariirhabdus haliotis]
MSDAQQETTTNTTTNQQKKIDNQDLSKSGFWISHLFTIAATIVGVYLAAQAGLNQALVFDALQTKQNNFYLRESLYAELADNAAQLADYNSEVLSKNLSTNAIKMANPKLDTYVWDTMKFSPTTLETPTYFLTETRRFYAEVNDIIEKVEAFHYGNKYASGLLQQQLDQMNNLVLPKLKASAEAIRVDLEQHDVEVDLQDGVK